MNDYITKPIYPDELISTLVKWIEPKERVTDPHEPKPISYGKDDLSIDQAISFKDILPGITVKDGLKRVGGNRWLYQKLLTMFLMNHRNTVQDIESALNSGDRDQAILLSHTLKGLAGTICAHDLQKAAADLEAALKLETEQWRDLLDHVSHLLTQVLSGITSLEKGDHYNE
jgi:HPt (histidine-containing phosphotransfer) domain-containing protein